MRLCELTLVVFVASIASSVLALLFDWWLISSGRLTITERTWSNPWIAAPLIFNQVLALASLSVHLLVKPAEKPMIAYSFRCKACGFLESGDHAAEGHHPAACRVCGDGVRFCPRRGTKSLLPENWEKLWEATDERLAELGLCREQIEPHEAWPASVQDQLGEMGLIARQPRRVEVTAGDGVSSVDRVGGVKG